MFSSFLHGKWLKNIIFSYLRQAKSEISLKFVEKYILFVFILLTGCSLKAQESSPKSVRLSIPGLLWSANTMRGAQVSLISSSAHERLLGVQLSGISNYAHSGKGVQMALFNNVAGVGFSGVQMSGVSNVALNIRKGLQMSALLNVAEGDMRGLQVAMYNYADNMNGSQIGFINVCVHHPKGVQIGIVNISQDTIAHKIGLVNVNPKTRIQLMAYAGNASAINTAVRFRNTSTYYILGIGTHYLGLDRHCSGALFYRIGQYFSLTPKLSISGDAGYYHIETFQEHRPDVPERLFSLQGRLNLDYQLWHKVGLFVSTGYGNTRYYYKDRLYKHEFILEGGITLF